MVLCAPKLADRIAFCICTVWMMCEIYFWFGDTRNIAASPFLTEN